MGDDEYGPATAARAKWDFVPEEPSGLALTADDELEVWPTEKGWWFARKKRGGYEGYVPRDYVRVEGRHAEAAFPGLSARVATISPRRRLSCASLASSGSTPTIATCGRLIFSRFTLI